VRVLLLGEVEVWASDRAFDVGLPRQQAVLAALLVAATRPVPVATLIDQVWGDTPPASVRNVLYSHVSRVRRMFREIAAVTGDAPGQVRRRAAGYAVQIDTDVVDLHVFRRLVDEAADAKLAEPDRVAKLREALDLWRGQPLAGVPGDWAASMRESWQRERLEASLRWAGASLRVGEPQAVVAPLVDLVTEFPLVEPLEGLLMRALHAAGRDAEALARFAALRRRLIEQLGTEPGADLRRLHSSILRGDLLDEPAKEATRVRAPAQLPSDVDTFTGRASELSKLDRLRSGRSGAATSVFVISGTAGVGKTALAVRWAHHVRAEFPDGQLYANLRGYDPDDVVPPAQALAGFLYALGVPGPEVPVEVDDRAARFRTEVSGRRMLIVLDNAATEEQIRPLLPGTSTCLVLVTSRDRLAGLTARDGARRFALDLLPLPDAVALQGALIGDRVDATPDAFATLAGQCARLPLALRVAAVRAAARPETPLSDLVDELADLRLRLDQLTTGDDPRTAVRAVLSWSYEALPDDAARTFRLLGLHPAADHDTMAAAALLDGDLRTAYSQLDVLAAAHLIQPVGADRYTMHDLLRAYAHDLAVAVESEEDRRAAVDRLQAHYLAYAAAAMDALYPGDRDSRPRVPAPRRAAPAESGPAESGPAEKGPAESGPALDGPAALAWLDAERATMAAVHAAASTDSEYPVLLASTLARYLDVRGHHPDARLMHAHALATAERTGDKAAQVVAIMNLGVVALQQGSYDDAARQFEHGLALCQQTMDSAGQAEAYRYLGVVAYRQGRFDAAIVHLEQSLSVQQLIDDPVGRARTLVVLSNVQWQRGHYEAAAEGYRQALDLAQLAGERVVEGYALDNLGTIYQRLGHLDAAADHYRSALAINRGMGDRQSEAYTLGHLAEVECALGRLDSAAQLTEEALDLCRDTGDRYGEAHLVSQVGLVHDARGDRTQAATCHRQAVEMFRELGDRSGEVEVLNRLGATLMAIGQIEAARAVHVDALALAQELGDRYEQGRAHRGIAETHRVEGDPRSARQHLREALAIHAELGVPDARETLAQLRALERRRIHAGY